MKVMKIKTFRIIKDQKMFAILIILSEKKIPKQYLQKYAVICGKMNRYISFMRTNYQWAQDTQEKNNIGWCGRGSG